MPNARARQRMLSRGAQGRTRGHTIKIWSRDIARQVCAPAAVLPRAMVWACHLAMKATAARTAHRAARLLLEVRASSVRSCALRASSYGGRRDCALPGACSASEARPRGRRSERADWVGTAGWCPSLGPSRRCCASRRLRLLPRPTQSDTFRSEVRVVSPTCVLACRSQVMRANAGADRPAGEAAVGEAIVHESLHLRLRGCRAMPSSTYM